jgi:hypothetical protein
MREVRRSGHQPTKTSVLPLKQTSNPANLHELEPTAYKGGPCEAAVPSKTGLLFKRVCSFGRFASERALGPQPAQG